MVRPDAILSASRCGAAACAGTPRGPRLPPPALEHLVNAPAGQRTPVLLREPQVRIRRPLMPGSFPHVPVDGDSGLAPECDDAVPAALAPDAGRSRSISSTSMPAISARRTPAPSGTGCWRTHRSECPRARRSIRGCGRRARLPSPWPQASPSRLAGPPASVLGAAPRV